MNGCITLTPSIAVRISERMHSKDTNAPAVFATVETRTNAWSCSLNLMTGRSITLGTPIKTGTGIRMTLRSGPVGIPCSQTSDCHLRCNLTAPSPYADSGGVGGQAAGNCWTGYMGGGTVG